MSIAIVLFGAPFVLSAGCTNSGSGGAPSTTGLSGAGGLGNGGAPPPGGTDNGGLAPYYPATGGSADAALEPPPLKPRIAACSTFTAYDDASSSAGADSGALSPCSSGKPLLPALLSASDVGNGVVFVGLYQDFVIATRSTDAGREFFVVEYDPGAVPPFYAHHLSSAFRAFEIRAVTAAPGGTAWLALACDPSTCSILQFTQNSDLVPSSYPNPPKGDYVAMSGPCSDCANPSGPVCLESPDGSVCLSNGAWVVAPKPAPGAPPELCCPIASADVFHVWVTPYSSQVEFRTAVTTSGEVVTDDTVRSGAGPCCSLGRYGAPIAADQFFCGLIDNIRLLTADTLWGVTGCAID